jgi:hypothetical protein
MQTQASRPAASGPKVWSAVDLEKKANLDKLAFSPLTMTQLFHLTGAVFTFRVTRHDL